VYIGVWHTAVKAVGHIPSTWFAHLKVCDLRFRDLSFKSSHSPEAHKAPARIYTEGAIGAHHPPQGRGGRRSP